MKYPPANVATRTVPRNRPRRRLVSPVARLAAAAATLAALTIGVVTIRSATADASNACSYRNFCAWQDPGYGGSRAQWYGYSEWWPAYIRNDESSVRNASPDYTVRVFSAYSFSGTYLYCTPAGHSYGTMGTPNNGASHNWFSGAYNC